MQGAKLDKRKPGGGLSAAPRLKVSGRHVAARYHSRTRT